MTLPAWAQYRLDEARLTGQTHLDLGGAGQRERLTEFPRQVFNLQNLETLYLTNNKIRFLPDDIELLQKLAVLRLRNNQLSKLPDSLLELNNLRLLDIGFNAFSSFPTVICSLKNLKHLDITGNDLKEIPSRLLDLRSLEGIDWEPNPIVTPPPEIMKKGVPAIKKYFQQLKNGEDTLYEAKLLILGEGGAGKTTLARKIKNPSALLFQEQKSTEGIDVLHWSFPTNQEKNFQVNIWDFGGQEIYHTTHQFFLTKRSLYVLVADTRAEDTDFYYWLNAVQLLSDNSPLLIVKNEKQDRHREINERQLKGEFGNIKDVLSTNLSTNRGLDNVIKSIKYYISNLPHIGTKLPKTWVDVRKKLEYDHRNWIGLDEYLEICKLNGFSKIEDSLQLSEYLHDIGVCLHFQDDPLLSKTVILKPKWGTDAVYKVLDNKDVIRKFGHFTRSDLSIIWGMAEYAKMHNELLQLMMKFKLCYQIPNILDTYIAPQLLTGNQPAFIWDNTENLLVRYSYKFMPKGILTQFIVVMHPFIEKQEYAWKTGVILEKNKTRASIIEYYNKREIHIKVSGMHKKELLTIITHEIEKIHATYNHLQYDELIPCNCIECKVLTEPYFFPFDRLQKFIEDKQEQIQCLRSYKMVKVRTLIDDVIISKNAGEAEKEAALSKNQFNLENAKNVTIVLDNDINALTIKNYEEPTEEIRNLVKELRLSIETIKPLIDNETADNLIDDINNLEREGNKKNIRKEHIRVTADGLVKAAENIGKIGKPVVELAGKIIAAIALMK